MVKSRGPESVSERPANLSFDADRWLSMLDVDIVRLTECRVSKGWALAFEGYDRPGIHYVLNGNGKLRVHGLQPLELTPHRAVIVPSSRSYQFEFGRGNEAPLSSRTITAAACSIETESKLEQCRAGQQEPELVLICGHFQLHDSTAENLFAQMQNVLAVSLSESDAIGSQLAAALGELDAGRPGASAMATAMLKQILITLFRKMLGTSDEWVMRLGLVRDLRIAKAFSWLMTHPERPHSVASLADVAAMSRSSFASGFRNAFGDGPMTILRNVRLARAAAILSGRDMTVEQVCRLVGYASRSSFTRAFRAAYGQDPTAFALSQRRR